MTMTDPIADFLTRLRNANSAYHDEVSLPHSKPTSVASGVALDVGQARGCGGRRHELAGAL